LSTTAWSKERYDPTDGGGRTTHGAVVESNAGAIADDCTDAGGRAMQGAIAET